MTESYASIATWANSTIFRDLSPLQLTAELNRAVAELFARAADPAVASGTLDPVAEAAMATMVTTAALAWRLEHRGLDLERLPGRFITGSSPAAAAAVVANTASSLLICMTTERSIQRQRKAVSFAGEVWIVTVGLVTLIGEHPRSLADRMMPTLRQAYLDATGQHPGRVQPADAPAEVEPEISARLLLVGGGRG